MNCICMYNPTAHGGHPRYTWELMKALAALHRGSYRFELVSSRNLDEQFISDSYRVHPILPPIAMRGLFTTKAGWMFNRVTHYPRREWQFLKWLKGRPDITGVHFQEWVPWLAAPMFRRIQAMGKKVYYTCHNVVPHRYPAFIPKRMMDAWIRNACLQCDGLFVLSDLLADELTRFIGRPHPPIQVVPHGVWTVPDFAKGPPLDQRLAWKKLLFFGAIRSNKGADLLLRAMEHLPGFSITLAGEPCNVEYFQSQILPEVKRLRTLGVKVDLIDRFIPDAEVGALFSSHSAIVLPYTSGFVAQSGVAFMALAYELPVVASEAGGLRDLFNQVKIGATFRDATPLALAAAVRALYADTQNDLARDIGTARRRFSWDAAARATMAGYALANEKFLETHDCAVTTTATP